MDEEIEKKVNNILPVTPKQQIFNKIPRRGLELEIKEGKIVEQKFFFVFSSSSFSFELMILDDETG